MHPNVKVLILRLKKIHEEGINWKMSPLTLMYFVSVRFCATISIHTVTSNRICVKTLTYKSDQHVFKCKRRRDICAHMQEVQVKTYPKKTHKTTTTRNTTRKRLENLTSTSHYVAVSDFRLETFLSSTWLAKGFIWSLLEDRPALIVSTTGGDEGRVWALRLGQVRRVFSPSTPPQQDSEIFINDKKTGTVDTFWNPTPELRQSRLTRCTVPPEEQGELESERWDCGGGKKKTIDQTSDFFSSQFLYWPRRRPSPSGCGSTWPGPSTTRTRRRPPTKSSSWRRRRGSRPASAKPNARSGSRRCSSRTPSLESGTTDTPSKCRDAFKRRTHTIVLVYEWLNEPKDSSLTFQSYFIIIP